MPYSIQVRINILERNLSFPKTHSTCRHNLTLVGPKFVLNYTNWTLFCYIGNNTHAKDFAHATNMKRYGCRRICYNWGTNGRFGCIQATCECNLMICNSLIRRSPILSEIVKLATHSHTKLSNTRNNLNAIRAAATHLQRNRKLWSLHPISFSPYQLTMKYYTVLRSVFLYSLRCTLHAVGLIRK